ncbi:hypothetical protein [Jeotgalibacillus sp. JSM ZJ347]|uniref:hypothetical protein n=1 Tax=Jeotgalibacillus sp. JSM ZJ347 TaxID=3342117 RepID=UPI0035A958EF
MEVNRKWLSITEQTRKMLIGNVCCGQCLDAVTIKDVIIASDPIDVVLEGKCADCGHPVARVVEMNE